MGVIPIYQRLFYVKIIQGGETNLIQEVLDIPAFVGVASPVSATLVVFWLIFRGSLVVRIQHDTIVRILEAQRDDAIGERDAWKLNSERKAETIQILTKTNNELMETAKFADHVMQAIQEKAGSSPQTGTGG